MFLKWAMWPISLFLYIISENRIIMRKDVFNLYFYYHIVKKVKQENFSIFSPLFNWSRFVKIGKRKSQFFVLFRFSLFTRVLWWESSLCTSDVCVIYAFVILFWQKIVRYHLKQRRNPEFHLLDAPMCGHGVGTKLV